MLKAVNEELNKEHATRDYQRRLERCEKSKLNFGE